MAGGWQGGHTVLGTDAAWESESALEHRGPQSWGRPPGQGGWWVEPCFEDPHHHLLGTTAIAAGDCPALRGSLGLLESSAHSSHTLRQFRAQDWNECSETWVSVHGGLTHCSQKAETGRTRINPLCGKNAAHQYKGAGSGRRKGSSTD